MPLPQPRAAANIRGRAIALPYGPRRALCRSGLREAPNLFVGAGFIPPGGVCAAAGFPGRTMCAPTRGARWRRVRGSPRGLRRFCLPCQREVARPKAVTEGLPYGGLLFERCAVTEGLPYSRHCAVPVWPETQNLFVGAGFIPPGVFSSLQTRANIESPPTKYLQYTQCTKTPARQPFSLNGRRAGFSCQVFLATLITGYPVCPCVFCPQSAPQWPPPPRSARRAPPPAGTCRWSAARTTARRSASGLRPRCRP